MEIINFKAGQLAKFDALAMLIQSEPELYLAFDSVSDFYKAQWLNDFPQGTTWSCTGLDNGADDFHAVIRFQNRVLKISSHAEIELKFEIDQCR